MGGASRSASIQLAPKSMERCSFDTLRSPAQAWPRSARLRPEMLVLVCGVVIRDFTGIDSMILKSSLSTLAPGATL